MGKKTQYKISQISFRDLLIGDTLKVTRDFQDIEDASFIFPDL